MNDSSNIARAVAHCCLKTIYGSPIGRRLINGVSRWLDQRTIEVNVRDAKLTFLAGLGHSTRRASGMEHKEPETLDWIDSFEQGSVFWDVGASTGIYAIYAAVSKRIEVVAIEPSPYNTSIIATNTRLNHVEDLISLLPCALNTRTSICTFALVSNEIGSSQHQVLTTNSSLGLTSHLYKVPSFSIDFLVESCGIPRPHYIKIDVDGLEHLILQGGERTLEKVRSVLVEIPDSESARVAVDQSLTRAGLVHLRSSRSNCIWVR